MQNLTLKNMGVSIMKKMIVLFTLLLIFIGGNLVNAKLSNQEQALISADEFYKTYVDKQRYEEYIDSKIKTRKLSTIKALPKVIDEMKWDYESSKQPQYMKEDFIRYTKRFEPERKVYYFFSLKDTGHDVFYQAAMYDAETKELMYADKGNW
jgi:hypothetical protein